MEKVRSWALVVLAGLGLFATLLNISAVAQTPPSKPVPEKAQPPAQTPPSQPVPEQAQPPAQTPPSEPAPQQVQPPAQAPASQPVPGQLPTEMQAPVMTLAPMAPPIVPVAGYGRLRVYRARRYAGSALAPSIYVDATQVARVGSGRRVTIHLTPGQHTIRSDDKSSNISLDVKAGQDYYIRVDEEFGFWKGHGKLTLMLAEQGGPEYKLQRAIEDDRKIAREMIEEDTEPIAQKPN